MKECNCPTQSGREFVREMNYVQHVLPIHVKGEETRKTVSHACGEITNTAFVVALAGTLTYATIGLGTYALRNFLEYLDKRSEKKAAKKKQQINK